ncbi:hypothetical protein C0991_004415 [Blastosporella zonata]|nr:hypothetical protein C0991_004415 [Blastosporella zonata]
MLRSNLQTLRSKNTAATTPPPPPPTIRLISATPSASGNSSSSSITNIAIDSSWNSGPSSLAPKVDSPATRKRLVPKKSKLSMLGVGREKDRGKDLSDVVRRVGGDSTSARGGFEIYVDPTMDEDIAEILVVKKQKSRVALNGMRWGTLGEVTNVPAVTAPKEAPTLLKVKNEENKWWSIGRGRKDSKDKTEKSVARAKSPVRDPYPRSKTPEPFKLTQPAEPSRARFNSLDSGILLNTAPIAMGAAFSNQQVIPMPPMTEDRPKPSPTLTYTRSGTPSAGGLLAPPGAAPQANPANQGSIALRAMRSVRSMARIGSWAQPKNSDENMPVGSVRVKTTKEKKEKKEKEKKEKEKEKKEKEKTVKEKKVKEDGKKKTTKKSKEKENKKDTGREGDDSKKKKTKKRESTKDTLEPTATLRLSTSSFEIGAPTPMPKEKAQTLGKKKHSILGLGLPSTMTMRLPSVRNGSSASSIGPSVPPPLPNPSRLSVDSAQVLNMGTTRDRAGSVMSTSTTGSSLRPKSTTSSMSGSGLSSGSSVRWDEDCLENVKETRRRERKERERERTASEEVEGKRSESRHSLEGRKRTPLSDVFPMFARAESPLKREMPVVMVEAATADGHGAPDDDSILEEDEGQQGLPVEEEELPMETPVKRARPRPLSEQLLGKSRPKPMYEGEDGVLSILDAATNDLAQLINHLDLEATPVTPDMTPLRPLNAPLSSAKSGDSTRTYSQDSPTKNMLSGGTVRKSAHKMPSISSLRPYAQSRKNMPAMAIPSIPECFIGQQIAPWATLRQTVSPVKSLKRTSVQPLYDAPLNADTPMQTVRPTHKRTLTPGPEPEASPVFQPLRPAKSRSALAALRAPFEVEQKKQKTEEGSSPFNGTVRAPSLRTFGSHSSSRVAQSVLDASFTSEALPTPSPVFKRALPAPIHRRQQSHLAPMELDEQYDEDNDTVPIPLSARRILGMSGTMGGSDVSAYCVELDVSDPDSDIPDELQNILSGQSDDGDTMSFRDVNQESPDVSFVGSTIEHELLSDPPVLELPTFRAQLIDEEENEAILDADVDAMSSDEDNTKKSFDFTGEIKKLNESVGSDRQSFVAQLEEAFRTPAKINLRYGFSSLTVEIPPVPKLPAHLLSESSKSSSSAFDSYSGSGIADMKEPTLLHADIMDESDEKSRFDLFSGSQLVDMREPTLLQGSDSLTSSDQTQDIVMSDSEASASTSRSLRTASSSASRPSDGQLNTAFKFGGLPKVPQAPAVELQDKPKTLADIIPPPSHVRSLSNSSSIMEDEDSVLNSILAHVSEIPRPRIRVNSDSSVKQRLRAQIQYRHSRHSSGMSFAGFDSFDEVRRGFEFSNEQPFYPPPAAGGRLNTHRRQQESIFSIASVSSYGRAHDYGLPDPFDDGLPSLRERPSSEDMSSTSMSMSVDDTFSFLDHQPRRRVASDASSFYFKAPSTQSFNRGHRRHESNMSVSSFAPPVSLYNRSFGSHRRNDSTSSAQSVALSYTTHGASGGRAAWARHRQDSSMDSVNSDFSAMRLGRPGIGDKMFDKTFGDSTGDHGMPLPAISASPPESLADRHFANRSSFDFDSIMDHDRRSSTVEDSLFEKTGFRDSVASDSIFGCNDSKASTGASDQSPKYRPLSVLSFNAPNSPVREDDTMVTMLGGGHVRRRSIDASPCPRIEKRKHSAINPQGFSEYRESPTKARIVEKPSIASTSSFSFGGERMIKARHGLLERRSLEDSCLIADGEELESSLQNDSLFTRPGPATRSRSSTCTSSSGGDTPPLSSSDGGTSMDEGSQCSIDLSQINVALANTTHPMSTLARHRVRARARGHGHRRRASYIRASRTSVYETIEEEISPSPNKPALSEKGTPTVCQPIFIVEPDTSDVEPTQIWNDENGIMALRRYYALKDEAQTTVVESKRIWHDTPFSIYAVQSFEPPRHPAGMKALLEHSVQNYGPLPSELRPRRIRSRTSSRASPYPQARVSKVIPPSPEEKVQPVQSIPANAPVLRQVPINHNIMSAAPSLEALKPFSSLVVDIEPKRENAFGLAPHARPRVASTARRTALGWSKRSTGGSSKLSTDQKENVGQGMIMTSGESLRINRPRPRGRPTPASTARPIRV